MGHYERLKLNETELISGEIIYYDKTYSTSIIMFIIFLGNLTFKAIEEKLSVGKLCFPF